MISAFSSCDGYDHNFLEWEGWLSSEHEGGSWTLEGLTWNKWAGSQVRTFAERGGPFHCWLPPQIQSFLNQRHQYHLGTWQKCKFSSLTPGLTESEPMGVIPSNWCFNKFSRPFRYASILRHIALSQQESRSSCSDWFRGGHVTLFWLMRYDGRFVLEASGKNSCS